MFIEVSLEEKKEQRVIAYHTRFKCLLFFPSYAKAVEHIQYINSTHPGDEHGWLVYEVGQQLPSYFPAKT